MKKLSALLLGLLLLLPAGGCSLLLERSYTNEAPHAQFSDEEAGSSVLRAETYQGLVSAILHLISQGEDGGVVRLYNYTDAAEADLEAACLEVTQQDPLGVYAVEFIQYDLARVVSYYQADLTISYRRTPAQIAAVVSVTGSGGIENGLREALALHSDYLALRVAYFQGDEAAVADMVADAYYDVPEAALGLPQATVTLYPDSGQQRLVEIQLDYPQPAADLARQEKALAALAQELADPLTPRTGAALRDWVLTAVASRVTYSDQGGSNAYEALTQGAGDAEGTALTVLLACRQAGLECQLIRGTRNGAPWFWNLIQADGMWRHVDLTVSPLPWEDDALSQAGYQWDRDATPAAAPAVTPTTGGA